MQLRIPFDPAYPDFLGATKLSTWGVVGEATTLDSAWLPRTAARIEGNEFVWDLREPIPAGRAISIYVTVPTPRSYSPVDSTAILPATAVSSNATPADAPPVSWRITGAGMINTTQLVPSTILLNDTVEIKPRFNVNGTASETGDVTFVTTNTSRDRIHRSYTC